MKSPLSSFFPEGVSLQKVGFTSNYPKANQMKSPRHTKSRVNIQAVLSKTKRTAYATQKAGSTSKQSKEKQNEKPTPHKKAVLSKTK